MVVNQVKHLVTNIGQNMNKIHLKYLTKTTLLIDNSIEPKNRIKKIKKGEDLFACILCLCMTSLVKGLDTEKYIRINKIPNIEISPNKRKIFEDNYKHALEMEKKYNANEVKDFRFYMPNLSNFYNNILTPKTFIAKLIENVTLQVLTLEPIIPVLQTLYQIKTVKDDAKISNIFSLVQDVYNKGSNVLNFTTQYRNNQTTLGSLIVPFFSVANFVHLAKALASSTSMDVISVGRDAIDAVDRDLAHIGKKVVEAKAHKAFMDFIVLPELNVVKKYPFFKPILFANPVNILEIGSQVRQLYKEHYDAEFSNMLKKNTALICGYEPNSRADNANKPKDDHIDDYVI